MVGTPQDVADCANIWLGQLALGTEVKYLLKTPNDSLMAYFTGSCSAENILIEVFVEGTSFMRPREYWSPCGPYG